MSVRMLGREVNAPIILLVLGLIAGVLIGYVTLPVERSAINLGPIHLEAHGQKPEVGDNLTDRQTRHVLTIMLIGGVLGLAGGFVIQRARA